MDIDQYDEYYQNLFIWDTKARRIVGGYRIGPGSSIFEKFGVKGFYISASLFKIKAWVFTKLYKNRLN